MNEAYGDDERRSSHQLVRPALNPPSAASASSSFKVAVIVAPSSEGQQEFLTVDVYAAGVASLSSPPTQSAVLARSTSTSNYFYRGEVVGVRTIDGELRVYKFFQVNSEVIGPGALWLRPFCADAAFSGSITYDTTAGAAPPLCLQDMVFDYAAVIAVLDTAATLLEVLGDYKSTHTIHAIFLPANMVPVKPEASLLASVCAVIAGKTNHSYGTVTALGTWLSSTFAGAITSNEGASYSGTLAIQTNTRIGLVSRYTNGLFGATADQIVLAPARVQTTTLDSSSLEASNNAWHANLIGPAAAGKPAYVTTSGAIARSRAAALLVASFCNDGANSSLIRSYRWIPPTLVWKTTLATATATIVGASPLVNPQVWS